jgi:hypothetical protein
VHFSLYEANLWSDKQYRGYYAKKEIKELIEKKIIRRVGKGKDTFYIFVTE